eukprot:7124391-Karenia_brevis.AAC.1
MAGITLLDFIHEVPCASKDGRWDTWAHESLVANDIKGTADLGQVTYEEIQWNEGSSRGKRMFAK